VGRTYEAVIRVNSQSGKGGVAYLMKAEHGLDLPRRLQIEFSKAVQKVTEDTGTVVTPEEIWAAFEGEYLPENPAIELVSHDFSSHEGKTRIVATIRYEGKERVVAGTGNGPIAALVNALHSELGVLVEVLDYVEHAVSAGANATAVAYVEARNSESTTWGVGMDESIVAASLKAVLSAVNRLGVESE
jgi:2-isopropylmalate synthase